MQRSPWYLGTSSVNGQSTIGDGVRRPQNHRVRVWVIVFTAGKGQGGWCEYARLGHMVMPGKERLVVGYAGDLLLESSKGLGAFTV